MHCLQQRQYGFDGEPDEPSDLDFEAPTPLTREISKETAERAVNLTEYFQDQRKHYEDVRIQINLDLYSRYKINTASKV